MTCYCKMSEASENLIEFLKSYQNFFGNMELVLFENSEIKFMDSELRRCTSEILHRYSLHSHYCCRLNIISSHSKRHTSYAILTNGIPLSNLNRRITAQHHSSLSDMFALCDYNNIKSKIKLQTYIENKTRYDDERC